MRGDFGAAAVKAFEPKILGFLCTWCSYAAADAVSSTEKKFPHNVRFIRLMCTGRIDPEFIMKGFQSGADAVIILGCHPGDCHYGQGNYAALRRFYLLRRVLSQFGIAERRLRLEWVSACEPEKLAETLEAMSEEIKVMGPLQREIAAGAGNYKR